MFVSLKENLYILTAELVRDGLGKRAVVWVQNCSSHRTQIGVWLLVVSLWDQLLGKYCSTLYSWLEWWHGAHHQQACPQYQTGHSDECTGGHPCSSGRLMGWRNELRGASGSSAKASAKACVWGGITPLAVEQPGGWLLNEQLCKRNPKPNSIPGCSGGQQVAQEPQYAQVAKAECIPGCVSRNTTGRVKGGLLSLAQHSGDWVLGVWFGLPCSRPMAYRSNSSKAT